MKVVVTANPKNGQVFTKYEGLGKDGKQYGFIRVESSTLVNNGGFLATKVRSALIPMSEDNFNKSGIKAGFELGGRIIRLESLEQKPGYTAKLAGKDGVPCTKGGQPIYQTTMWVTADEQDELIAHDNVIVGSSATAKKSDAIN